MTMLAQRSINSRFHLQMLLGGAGCIAAAGLFAVGGELLVIRAVLLVLLLAICPPSFLVLAFVCFSYFRIHEAYPILIDLKLPLLLSMASLAVVGLAVFNGARDATDRHRIWLGPALAATGLAAALLFVTGVEPSGNVDRLYAIIALGSAAAAILCWFFVLEGGAKASWNQEAKLLVAFVIVATLGVPLASNAAIALSYWSSIYWKIIAMSLVLAWLLRTRAEFANAIVLVVASGSLIAARAFYNWYYSIDLVEGTRVTIGRTLFSTPDDIANAVPGGLVPGGSLLGDPNDLALVMLFPVGFALAGAIRLGRSSPLGWLCFLALPLLVGAIILTQSRGGALGVLAVFGTVGLYYIRSKALVLTVAAVGAVALVAAMDIGGRRSGGLDEYRDASIDVSALERIYAWSSALNMTASNPLTGVGIKNFAPQFQSYSPVWVAREMDVHNTWLGVMAETGVPGFIIFMSLIVTLWRVLLRLMRRQSDGEDDHILAAFSLALLAALAGFCVSGTFLTQGFTWPIYILVGLTIALTRAAHATRGHNDQFGLPVESAGSGPQMPDRHKSKRHTRSSHQRSTTT